MRIAVVVDWLYVFGGAERVLAAILECYPESDLFCLFDVLPDDARALLGGKRSRSTFLQKLPGIARNHRRYLPLMPIAIEQIDLSGYDLVLSSSHAVAKGVLTGPDQIHLSYVLSPMRYAWDLQHQYLREAQMTRGLKGSMARVLLHHMRLWDTRTANSVDSYAAISNFISRRVRKVYGREAEVIYPPVAVPQMLTHRPKEDFFLAASRLVSYKNIHCIVEAFRQLPAERLIVVGEGPEAARLRASAGPNVSMAGFVSDAKLRALMGAARAFIFAAEEDFGIVPVEAQAEGTPVIALGRGGARETVLHDGPAPSGLFFSSEESDVIAEAVQTFIRREHEFVAENCHANALRFSTDKFKAKFTDFVSRNVAAPPPLRIPPFLGSLVEN
jgi:glycosyltransferase involved in cell wall biosynthesis